MILAASGRDAALGDLLRDLTPQVLAVVARDGDFAAAEDAVQEALLAASQQWAADAVPDNPVGWLVRVARRRLIDQWRADTARRARELSAAADPTSPLGGAPLPATTDPDPAPDHAPAPGRDPDRDDTLTLLMLCCHPCLSPAAAIALTLRAVAGLTTSQIATAFLVPETTMGQRINRAKQRLRATGARFITPTRQQRQARLTAVLHVIYLMFNEGYLGEGDHLDRPDLADEAIRIARILHRAEPDHPEATGLVALLLLTHARRAARTGPTGWLIPLAEQDRSLWDRQAITEGRRLLLTALSHGTAGPYQIQAAIAALHDEAPSADETDWPQILALYTLLERMTPGPMVSLNRAVAFGMAQGPDHGLALLETLNGLADHHRLHAVRAHLLDRAGRSDEARTEFEVAARLAKNVPERLYLAAQAARLSRPLGDLPVNPPRGSGPRAGRTAAEAEAARPPWPQGVPGAE